MTLLSVTVTEIAQGSAEYYSKVPGCERTPAVPPLRFYLDLWGGAYRGLLPLPPGCSTAIDLSRFEGRDPDMTFVRVLFHIDDEGLEQRLLEQGGGELHRGCHLPDDPDSV